MKDELKRTHASSNPLIKIFFRTKTNLAIKIACLKKSDIILDYGCGGGFLKNKLKSMGFNALGYDITPEHSDLEDYRELNPNKIFAIDVFEHIDKKEVIKIIRDFKVMNPNFNLIVIIPTENFISRKIRRLLGKSERVSDHITPLNEILKILNSELKLIKKVNFLSISYIAKFRNQ